MYTVSNPSIMVHHEMILYQCNIIVILQWS